MILRPLAKQEMNLVDKSRTVHSKFVLKIPGDATTSQADNSVIKFTLNTHECFRKINDQSLQVLLIRIHFGFHFHCSY